MMQALHDNSITQAVQQVRRRRRIAGIMGGARVEPGRAGLSPDRRACAPPDTCGILVCTGGGPGAMEAAHLGAAHAPLRDSDLDAAVRRALSEPKVPDLRAIVASDGTVDQGLVAQGYKWLKPAYDIAQGLAKVEQGRASPSQPGNTGVSPRRLSQR